MKPMKFKGTLDTETLADEYVNWFGENGTKRNCNNLRFGQYLCNTYLREGQTFPDLFYTEGTDNAYRLAQEEIWYG